MQKTLGYWWSGDGRILLSSSNKKLEGVDSPVSIYEGSSESSWDSTVTYTSSAKLEEIDITSQLIQGQHRFLKISGSPPIYLYKCVSSCDFNYYPYMYTLKVKNAEFSLVKKTCYSYDMEYSPRYLSTEPQPGGNSELYLYGTMEISKIVYDYENRKYTDEEELLYTINGSEDGTSIDLSSYDFYFDDRSAPEEQWVEVNLKIKFTGEKCGLSLTKLEENEIPEKINLFAVTLE